jgi:peptidyl-prolyl cis-trans isomerase C
VTKARSRALLLSLALLPAIGRASVPPPSPAVATGVGVRLTVGELEARIAAMPGPARSAYASDEARRELLDSMILFQLMAREAERDGLDPGQAPGEEGRRRAVQRHVQRRFHDPDGPATVPDAEVRRYYAEHAAEYHQPVRMRVSWITFEAPEGSARRDAIRQRAAALRSRIAADGASDPGAFARAVERIAREADPETTAVAVSLLSREELGRAFTEEVADAAWALPPGRPSPVLASPRGFHILEGSGGLPARDVTLEQARGTIRIVLYQARMAEEYRGWIADLRANAGVRIDAAELARMAPGPARPAAKPVP